MKFFMFSNTNALHFELFKIIIQIIAIINA